MKSIQHSRKTHQNLSYQIRKSFNKNEIVILEVKYGEFTFTLKILNVDHNNHLTEIGKISEGKFGGVHIIPYLGGKIALKSIKYIQDIEEKKKMEENK